MSDHIKPTKEQLQANVEAAQKAIDDLDKSSAEEEKATQEAAEKARKEAEAQDDTDDGEDEEEKEQDTNAGDEDTTKAKPEAETKEEKEEKSEDDETDYKKRYSDSTREAQILAAKNRKLAEAYEKANSLGEPTEEELRQEYPDYDELSESQKKMAKKTMLNDKRFSVIDSVQQEFKDADSWSKKVDDFSTDPQVLIKNPDLEGKTDAFKLFATKESRRGIDFDTLVSAFLHDVSKTRIKHKGKMFEDGTGGSNEKRRQTQTGKLSMDEASKLRTSNYKLYTQYLREGKIDTSTIE